MDPVLTAPASRGLASSSMGDGTALSVLVHGFLGSGKNLRALALRLEAGTPDTRFLLPDLTGHGASPPLPPVANLSVMAVDLLALIDAQSPRAPVPLVGHSLGGRVALAAARLRPGAVSEIVLLDISPGMRDPRQSESRRVLDLLVRAPDSVTSRREMRTFFTQGGLSEGLSDWILMNLQPEGDRYVWRFDRQALDALHGPVMSEDLWAIVESPLVPVRCIRGARSGYVSDTDVARMEAAGCRVDTLPDAGHYVHVDAPAALCALLASVK